MAVSCNHGDRVDTAAAAELWKFLSDFKPDYRVHLGDVWDTAAWRAGAKGTADEGADVASDWDAGCEFLRRFEPHTVFLGNHDVRPHRFLRHPNALLRDAAAGYVSNIERVVRDELKAELIDYDIRTGWRMLGDRAMCHGWMFSENAIRDHVELAGRPVLMGHLHYVGEQVGRCIGGPVGSCVGALCDIDQMDYAKTRRATTRWANGWAWGTFTDASCDVHLHRVRRPLAIAAARLPEFTDEAAGGENGCRIGHRI